MIRHKEMIKVDFKDYRNLNNIAKKHCEFKTEIVNVYDGKHKPCIKCGCEKSTTIEYADGTFETTICDRCDQLGKVTTNQDKKIKYFKSISVIPINLEGATFDNFEKNLDKSVLNAYQGAKYHLNQVDKDHQKSLMLVGGIGCGKTHISVALSKEFMKKGLSVYFVPFSTLMREIRQTFDKRNDKTTKQIFDDIKKCDVFILDDVGVGSFTDFEMNTLYEIITLRHGMSNVYSSNLSSEEFHKNKDWKRISSRLFDTQTTSTLKIITQDYRARPQF